VRGEEGEEGWYKTLVLRNEKKRNTEILPKKVQKSYKE
jgi:hypothetical protein